MPENPSGGEKTELPTPKRLEEARNEGQVAMSTEVNIAGLLLVGFVLLAVMGPSFWTAMVATVRHALGDGLAMELTDRQTARLLIQQHWPALQWMLPFLGILFVTAIILGTAQVGFHPSLKPLEPKLTRINPVTGLSRLFGMRGLIRFVTNLLKLTLMLVVAWHILSSEMAHVTRLNTDVRSQLAHECWWLWTIAIKLAVILAAIATADFLYQRWQHTRDLMMTKQEVKEEMKQSEGDPHVKGKIRQIQRQMAQRRMMQEVPKADVVITNPTHVAVALKYDKDKMAAPVVVAKGYDAIAQKIKELARENGVMLVENVALARALAKEVEIGHPVPTKWYQAVAEVLSLVYKLRRKAG